MILLFLPFGILNAQRIPRPDAFPPVDKTKPAKELDMATSVDQLRQWDTYPQYSVYLDFMQQLANTHPDICNLDTIGYSIEGRLILSLRIFTDTSDRQRPEFFYSATIHGDELLPFYLMLRLADTLLNGYGRNHEITQLIEQTQVVINPLSNPDGTYHGGDHTVASAWRYNALGVDLNRNYPDPFGAETLDTLQVENSAMIRYVSGRHFVMSANLHSGAEVLNYPWDSFTSFQRKHEHSEWWENVCKRFIDTCRLRNRQAMSDVSTSGYIAGGDWYVIRNGRQDYMNYFHGIRELTMELSEEKRTPGAQLNNYWNLYASSLINFIGEALSLDTPISAPSATLPHLSVYPNPTRGPVFVQSSTHLYYYDLKHYPIGVHLLDVEGKRIKVIKR